MTSSFLTEFALAILATEFESSKSILEQLLGFQIEYSYCIIENLPIYVDQFPDISNNIAIVPVVTMYYFVRI